MSVPFINPDNFAQVEDYREGDFATDPPSQVDLDTDFAGIEDAPVLSTEAVEATDHLSKESNEHD